MHISKVELENFKSHANSAFEFERGTTAITGENGAGKTSIIEAVAWTIFDTLEYKKEDIVRRGAKKGSARVTFESRLDEREYTVYRDTGTGYYVYDPQLKMRIADKKEEVTRFLWQHLGIEPGTDLESLFKHAIGVPQGTFTSIFMAAAAERKRTFDSLLKVEEYRRSSSELLKTARYIEQQIAEVNVKIARSEGEIGRLDQVESDLKTVALQMKEWTAKLDELSGLATEKEEIKLKLDSAETRLGEVLVDAERLRSELGRMELVLRHSEAEAVRSREAAAKVAEVKAGAEAHQAALGRMKELERERDERQKLRDELGKIEAAITAVSAEKKHASADLEKALSARSEMSALSELVKDQDRIEAEMPSTRSELSRAEGAAAQLKAVEERLGALRQVYRGATDELAAAREKAAAAAEAELLRTRDAEIVRELATVNAALDRDQRFQQEIKNGLCPILSERCLNLKVGETLESFVSSQFGELQMRIDVLVSEQVRVTDALKIAREAERFSAQISVLEARVGEIGEEGSRLKQQKESLESEAAKLDSIRQQLAEHETELGRLNNPKARMAVLERDAAREGEVRERITEIERNLERLESDRRISVEKLEAYKDLDQMLAETGELRDRTAEAYTVFISNQDAAARNEAAESALAEARSELESISTAVREAEALVTEAIRNYDRDRHTKVKAELLDNQRLQAEAKAFLDAAGKRERELTAEAEKLYEIRNAMQAEFRERERLQRIAETTDFIRSTLKEAEPLVARNYVHHVSLEANQMFREIRGDAECSLKWTEDYGIMLEEGGYDRPFNSLSGGEQMAAALSVRLALLKQLSDIHIAFFDEPTTNMDAERRENLAQQIGRISHFDQLFVISHDDTFEGYMDHEVRIDR